MRAVQAEYHAWYPVINQLIINDYSLARWVGLRHRPTSALIIKHQFSMACTWRRFKRDALSMANSDASHVSQNVWAWHHAQLFVWVNLWRIRTQCALHGSLDSVSQKVLNGKYWIRYFKWNHMLSKALRKPSSARPVQKRIRCCGTLSRVKSNLWASMIHIVDFKLSNERRSRKHSPARASTR